MSAIFNIFNQGGIIAYPTEAVFGLGCDPDNIDAIERILSIKKRPKSKGLILLAGAFEQLLPYINVEQLTSQQLDSILARWPNGTTQVLPALAKTSDFLTGDFDSIAVRVTNQPDVVSLCASTSKPIVSTSANFSGETPARTWQEMDATLLQSIDYLIKGETLNFQQPSTIIDGLTGDVFRT